jgi:surfeit locus 1 family protein
MTAPDSAAPPSRFRSGAIGSAIFVVLMLALTALFAGLGFWQWERLAEKQALIAAVESRLTLPPEHLPAVSEWEAIGPEFYDYRPLTVTGTYVPEGTVLVFTSLAGAKGEHSGPGYWVMTPFVVVGGGSVFVNRGFVPQASGPAFAGGGATPPGSITLTGIGRVSEKAGSFTPGTDVENRVEWVRNVERLARLAGPAAPPFAPVYLDLPAGDPGALPQGGETVVEFPNNHLGYALTWFGFALLTPVMLAFWLLRKRRRPASR